MYTSWYEFTNNVNAKHCAYRNNKSVSIDKHMHCTVKLVILHYGPHAAKLVCVDHYDAFITWIKESDISTMSRILKRQRMKVTNEFVKKTPYTPCNETALAKIKAMRAGAIDPHKDKITD